MTSLLARTSSEAHLYMDLRPCECGETTFPRNSSIIELEDGLGSRYTGVCPTCGREREFVFRLPSNVILPVIGQVVYGDGSPSQLLDPGEWAWVADRYAASCPADTSGLDQAEQRQVRLRLAAAAAATDEILVFLPDGAEEVPVEAFHSDLGQAVYDDEPDRFAADRLAVVRDTYRQMIAEIDARAS
jgi:hypothetical protein